MAPSTLGMVILAVAVLIFCVATARGAPTFAVHDVDTDADSVEGVHAADVDGDGDVDLLSAAFYGDSVAWYENEGAGSFQKHEISSSADGASAVFAIDLDKDGDVDVLVPLFQDDSVVWFQNDGSEAFVMRTITTAVNGASSVFGIDVDDDGSVDVITAGYYDDTVAWYENDGSESFTLHTISTSADGVRSVFAIDVDGDGDVDVLSASENDDTVTWYENDGSEIFTTHAITTSAAGAQSVFAIDLDIDGDVDVLSASMDDDKVSWYENDGAESFSRLDIEEDARNSRAATAADMDMDGDIDVVAVLTNLNSVAWYENNGAASFTKHVMLSDASAAWAVFVQDCDGDGDTDAVVGVWGADTVVWAENMLVSTAPTPAPTDTPKPTREASPQPTSAPTLQPSVLPSMAPSSEPTVSFVPTPAPSTDPTALPTFFPTAVPSSFPTAAPTAWPTPAPSTHPTTVPTMSPAPTAFPSHYPSTAPSIHPSPQPTPAPSQLPTVLPTVSPYPTQRPTVAPTPAPTSFCSNPVFREIELNGGAENARWGNDLTVTYVAEPCIGRFVYATLCKREDGGGATCWSREDNGVYESTVQRNDGEITLSLLRRPPANQVAHHYFFTVELVDDENSTLSSRSEDFFQISGTIGRDEATLNELSFADLIVIGILFVFEGLAVATAGAVYLARRKIDNPLPPTEDTPWWEKALCKKNSQSKPPPKKYQITLRTALTPPAAMLDFLSDVAFCAIDARRAGLAWFLPTLIHLSFVACMTLGLSISMMMKHPIHDPLESQGEEATSLGKQPMTSDLKNRIPRTDRWYYGEHGNAWFNGPLMLLAMIDIEMWQFFRWDYERLRRTPEDQMLKSAFLDYNQVRHSILLAAAEGFPELLIQILYLAYVQDSAVALLSVGVSAFNLFMRIVSRYEQISGAFFGPKPAHKAPLRADRINDAVVDSCGGAMGPMETHEPNSVELDVSNHHQGNCSSI